MSAAEKGEDWALVWVQRSDFANCAADDAAHFIPSWVGLGYLKKQLADLCECEARFAMRSAIVIGQVGRLPVA